MSDLKAYKCVNCTILRAEKVNAEHEAVTLRAELDALKERLAGLSAKWKEMADGPVPTDRAIGYDECAADLDGVLEKENSC